MENFDPKKHKLQVVCMHGLSGSVAAILSTLLLYPLENLKTRMQVM